MIKKETFRQKCRLFRENLSATAYQQKSAAIVEKVQALPEITQAATVHTYWPITGSEEVDTRPLVQALLKANKRVVLPVVDFSARPNPLLEHREFHQKTELKTNRWGITEPTNSKNIPISELDAVIVPALGADRQGHRVGYGGGFYDRFLSEVNVPTICLVYANCLTQQMFAEPHDIPLAIVVTENEVLRITS